MSVSKLPAALIQVLDAEGKVSNYEIEYTVTYAGDDPDIARQFKPGRVREEVSAEVFRAAAGIAEESAAEQCKLREQTISALKEQIASAEKAHEAIAEQLRTDNLKLESAVATLKQKVETAQRALQ